MRILSQDGKIDLPYENFSLSTTQDNCIVAARDVVARPTEMLIGVVAKYSTEAKARKAMEMLHGVYVAHENYKKLDGDVQIEVSKRAGIEKAIMYGGIFQFPADDEVEAVE